MDIKDQQDLARFLTEMQAETDRGLPLVVAAVIDEKLRETLAAFLVKGKSSDRLLSEGNAPVGTFSARIDACHALGLIDDFEYQEISLVRKVRNAFAHARHGLTFDDATVVSLCANLKTGLPTLVKLASGMARARFTYASVGLVTRLYYRPQWVIAEARKVREWVNPDDVRWRSSAEEPLPDGKTVLAIRATGVLGVYKRVDPGGSQES